MGEPWRTIPPHGHAFGLGFPAILMSHTIRLRGWILFLIITEEQMSKTADAILTALISGDLGTEQEWAIQSEYFQGKLGQLMLVNAHGVVIDDADNLYIDVEIYPTTEACEPFLFNSCVEGVATLCVQEYRRWEDMRKIRVTKTFFDAWLLAALQAISEEIG
jgi:hypothetical protein